MCNMPATQNGEITAEVISLEFNSLFGLLVEVASSSVLEEMENNYYQQQSSILSKPTSDVDWYTPRRIQPQRAAKTHDSYLEGLFISDLPSQNNQQKIKQTTPIKPSINASEDVSRLAIAPNSLEDIFSQKDQSDDLSIVNQKEKAIPHQHPIENLKM